jgi:hypothetical protein
MPHVLHQDLGREMDEKRWKKRENGIWGLKTGKWDGIWGYFPVFPSTSRFFSNQCRSLLKPNYLKMSDSKTVGSIETKTRITIVFFTVLHSTLLNPFAPIQ